MKHIKEMDLFLKESVQPINELGDTDPLEWDVIREDGRETVYGFELNPSESYEVFITRNRSNINVSFTVNGSSDKSVITNSGQALVVFSTVLAIVKHHLILDPTIESISFVPEKNYDEDDRRFRIYLYYIKKNFPGARIRLDSHYDSRGEWIGVDVVLPRQKMEKVEGER